MFMVWPIWSLYIKQFKFYGCRCRCCCEDGVREEVVESDVQILDLRRGGSAKRHGGTISGVTGGATSHITEKTLSPISIFDSLKAESSIR